MSSSAQDSQPLPANKEITQSKPRAAMTGTKKFHVIRTTLIYLFGYNLEPKSPDPQRLYSIHRRQVVAVQPFSHVRLFATPWTAACQASLSFTMFWSLLKLMSMELVMPPNHLVLCHPLLLLPSIFPNIRVFSKESALCIMWPKYWSFSFSISPSREYSGLISFRMDWFNLLAVKGLSSVFSNTTVQKHQFFGVRPSVWSNSQIHTWLLEKP